jgi:lysophospholipase L1-like esterase|tara:strand:+ start:1014 stop:1565 length:552 start_codon:yes stop_codon:yes gene_type:complete
MIWNEILCLGDSITFGARDEYKRSFPAELGQLLTKETNECYICHNCGISGETSSELLKRAWGNTKSHSNSKIMTLLIGTNDTQINTPEDIYEDNLKQIISMSKIHGMHVIVGTLPTLAFTPLYLSNTNNIEKYNKIIHNLSKSMGFNICDLSGLEKYYIDGVHFTHKGNIEIAKRFMETILNI